MPRPRRVVVTGLGIVSPIGNDADEVVASLKAGKSGIVAAPEYTEYGFRSQIHGSIKLNPADHIDRRLLRFMGDAAAYAYIAMGQAIEQAGLSEDEIKNERTGIIVGSGGASTSNQVAATGLTREHGATKKMGPFIVPRVMGSTVSANLSTAYGIRGINYSITSACSTSAHCIGNAAEMIAWGKQDRMFAGGGEELHWTMSQLFDAMGAMSSKFNDTPDKASRPYDKDRDGFVIAGGGAVVVLEEYETAKARGAKILGELTGFGATSDGADMVAPSGEGAVRCMQLALDEHARHASQSNKPVGYINTHGTATPVGDGRELAAIKEVFGDSMPAIASTKSLTGHSQGAAGAHEAIYSLLMLNNQFIAASANVESLDPDFEGFPIVTERQDDVPLQAVMSNSFGFGGTNASLIFTTVDD
ncbi:MAG: beta-ketoacyl-ACP synthase I [Alphaproteobacteria bacterium]|nr:beta-ketoacyl-ACP synthase I [Alphaproteobacteria bacterium SS10]